MATPGTLPVTPQDNLVTVKVHHNDNTRRFKIPLRDLGALVLPKKLRQLLGIPADTNVTFERFSDSAGCYVRLDSENVAVYKQLYRAAKAKSKLRIKVTVVEPKIPAPKENTSAELSNAPKNYFDTVLRTPVSAAKSESQCDPLSDLPNVTVLPSRPAPAERLKGWGALPADQANPPPYFFRNDQEDGTLPATHKAAAGGAFCIDCNHCGGSIANEHYHCSTCEKGDYDLCLQCINSGVTCERDDHWLIKRFVKDGVVTNSTTEKVAPRKPQVQETEKEPAVEVHEAPSEKAPEVPDAPISSANVEERICNACLKEIDGTNVVACLDCEDFDLCMACLLRNAHGHHPGHTFRLLQNRNFCLKDLVLSRCNPGRHYQHAAICDGCDKRINGVRHKCLTCPDWDYCSECIKHAARTHRDHRFIPVYEAMADPPQNRETHCGIYCDGPLCKTKSTYNYITGVRYKCVVCHDVDFCANCEALPTNTHNRTHPLVMFKTPIRNVSINTLNEDELGYTTSLGDRVHKSTSTQASVATAQDIPEMEAKPAEADLLAEKTESKPVEQLEHEAAADQSSNYEALFMRDTIPDGTTLPPNEVFQQTWTLHNPGPLAWPAGSDVRFVGGDSMFNVDTSRPSSIDSITSAMGSDRLSAPLEPNQTADFTVTLKTPNREGSAMSYWRLKLPDGTPFGHRLWCDVKVRANAPQPMAVDSESKANIKNGEGKQSEASGSRMIFPTLDKESPVTSTHEAMTAPTAPSVSNPSDGDEVESLALGDDDTEAGFVTDEEYDVLDASDQEFQDAKQAK